MTMRRPWALVAILAAVLTVAAVGVVVATHTEGDTEAAVADSKAGTEFSDRARRKCRQGYVRYEVEQFIRAVNSGDPVALEESIFERGEPSEGGVLNAGSFPVFSHGLDHRRRPKRFFSAFTRAEVVDHLVRRAEKGDRARLVQLDTGGRRSRDGAFQICNLSYVVWRDIGDRRKPGERFTGKGAVAFKGGVAVWNTGAPKRYFRR